MVQTGVVEIGQWGQRDGRPGAEQVSGWPKADIGKGALEEI